MFERFEFHYKFIELLITNVKHVFCNTDTKDLTGLFLNPKTVM